MYAQVSGTHWTSYDHCDLARCSETTQAHFCHSRPCLNRETGFGGAHQSLSLLQGGEAEGNVPSSHYHNDKNEHLYTWGKKEDERECVRAQEPSTWNSGRVFPNIQVVLAKVILAAAFSYKGHSVSVFAPGVKQRDFLLL